MEKEKDNDEDDKFVGMKKLWGFKFGFIFS
jgi:hypothetical protein